MVSGHQQYSGTMRNLESNSSNGTVEIQEAGPLKAMVTLRSRPLALKLFLFERKSIKDCYFYYQLLNVNPSQYSC